MHLPHEQTFALEMVYKELGTVDTLKYPLCLTGCGTAGPTRNQTFGYSAFEGSLTSVTGFASSITYHPSGMVNQIAHANGVTTTWSAGAYGMGRPNTIATSGATPNFPSGTYAYDGSGNIKSIGPDKYMYDRVSRLVAGSATVAGVTTPQSFGYDSAGNRTAPNVRMISPRDGWNSGGAQVTITGAGFRPGVTVQIGTAMATGVILDHSGQVRATLPAYAGQGPVSVTVNNPGGTGSSFTNGFWYKQSPCPRGDANGDNAITAADATYLQNYLTAGGPPPVCSGDANGDGSVNTTDVTYLNMFVAATGPAAAFSTATNRWVQDATYDDAGNMVTRLGYAYTWDGLNTMSALSGGGKNQRFLYAAGGERIGIFDVNTGSWTWRLRDLGNATLRELTSSGGTWGTTSWTWKKDYIYRGTSLLASVAATGGTRYFHGDHLGSPRSITNAAQFGELHAYYPFGAEATSVAGDTEPMKFTGHERDIAPGQTLDYLDYMHARYYNPTLTWFLSVDPVLDIKASMTNPQRWNRYSYVSNNPINGIDPTGRYEEDVHYQLTYALSRAAGFNPSQAGMIAGADQGVDDNPATSPFASTEVRAAYHFTSSERRAAMCSGFEKTGSLTALGQFFHAQQDSYSHAGYGAKAGHAAAGTRPDKTYNNPAKAMKMAFDTYSRLNQAADKLGISRTDRAAWGQIRSAVVAFTLAKNDKDKDAALHKLLGVIAAARQQ